MRGGERLGWADFAGHVGALAGVLSREGEGRWALFAEDAYAFAVGLLGIWQAGGRVVVAPNGQPGTLAEVQEDTRGLITDGVSAVSGRTMPALHPPTSRPWTPVRLARDAPRLELFTSGTAGSRKTVVKTIAHLEDEVIGLERQWGRELDGRQAVGTVSPQHIYGLLFRVLWPLCAGRVFRGEALLYPDEILGRLGPGERAYLITTPAHLRRFAAMPAAPAVADVCRPVFSSGAPLGAATAARLVETLGFAPLEVFGSTETGGVAWRQQTGEPGSLAWTPFEGVQVSLDPAGLLRVSSSYVSGPSPFTMADGAQMLADGRFTISGRTDRIVKVAGKRLALPEMEEQLLRHPAVAEAALTLVGPSGEPRVAAAVVLTEKGRARLREAGRRAVSGDLLSHLAPCWDRVLLPRLFRYVSRLPEDAQGKLSSAALTRLFEAEGDESGWAAEILDETTTPTGCRRRLRVPDAAAFEGHFPELVVVPGFVQLDWVMEAAESLWGRPMTMVGIEALKFKDLLHPGEIIVLHAERLEDPAGLGFRLARDDGRPVSSGRCWLAEDTP